MTKKRRKKQAYPSPFIKWAGGKTKLLPQYDSFFPVKFGSYIEPFLGGGAVFFHLKPERASLFDVNEELINCYRQVKDNPDGLMELLKEHKRRHDEDGKDYYYPVRAMDPEKMSDLERAARMIYLNKTCYNGLYRVNSKGEFNVPFGRYNNPGIYDPENLKAVSRILRNAVIEASDFRDVLDRADTGDLVYFDPPYHPLSSTSNFTDYTRLSFTEKDQEDLSEVFRALHEKGCLVMLSNSDTPFIRGLYKGFLVRTVSAPRFINSKASGRKAIKELLVRNFSKTRGIIKRA